MSITEKKRLVAAISKAPAEGYEGGLIVPDSEIRAFISKLRIRDVDTVAARFQVVADAIESTTDQFDAECLRRVTRVAKESRSGPYRNLMEAILDAIRRGPEGAFAARTTAGRTIERAFRFSPDYHEAICRYKDKLKTIRAEGTPAK